MLSLVKINLKESKKMNLSELENEKCDTFFKKFRSENK